MTDPIVAATAWTTSAIIVSLSGNVFLARTGGRWRVRGNNRWTTNFNAAIILTIHAVVLVLLEQGVLEPYLIGLYEENFTQIWQLFVASLIGFFLNFWRIAGIAQRHRAPFGIIAFGVGFAFAEGLKIFPIW